MHLIIIYVLRSVLCTVYCMCVCVCVCVACSEVGPASDFTKHGNVGLSDLMWWAL